MKYFSLIMLFLQCLTLTANGQNSKSMDREYLLYGMQHVTGKLQENSAAITTGNQRFAYLKNSGIDLTVHLLLRL